MLTIARLFLLLAFALTIPLVLGVAEGRRIVWTCLIAVLPLFWVLGGYHLWRRICPLAVMGQFGRLVGRPGTRKAGAWLSLNYLYAQYGLLVTAICMRLLWTNGDAPWLAAFLGGVALAAISTSFLFTGKTWCNYICPVGVVEKIYTEPSQLRPTKSSQ